MYVHILYVFDGDLIRGGASGAGVLHDVESRQTKRQVKLELWCKTFLDNIIATLHPYTYTHIGVTGAALEWLKSYIKAIIKHFILIGS